ncbi:hypothetical protein [Photobacterium sp. Hal280]|uniref:hypothetical protein n=1 Tax=Photobacterium sp. Hal280 TaxID=3035163 RepID=UPI00301DA037
MLLLTMAMVLSGLLLPGMRKNKIWRATLTPLASIIGSGFLVIAPLLGYAVGSWSTIAMLLIVLLAYCIGWVIRFNIAQLDKDANPAAPLLKVIEHTSKFTLSIAYLISIAFYIRLLASFVLHAFNMSTHIAIANSIATVCLLCIAITGVFRGLSGMEVAEEFAVSIKLSIIAALLVGLTAYQFQTPAESLFIPSAPVSDPIHALRLLAGMLLVVQGFETSRYLGSAYSARHRIQTMKYAQWLSALIYLVFVTLAHSLLPISNSSPSETAIITMSQQVSLLLPILLTVAAVMSQFSAAVADTAGFGGLFHEAIKKKHSERTGYTVAVCLAIVLIWSTNLFSIITLASQAFALFYLTQCMTAWLLAGEIQATTKRRWLRCAFTLLVIILALVVLFAIPAESL